MRAVIQRVTRCSVSVNNEIISSIGRGLFVLVGISKDDNEKDLEYIVRKILNIKFFNSENKRWSRNVVDEGLEVLCVSQFTLCYVLKGNRLDFHNAMKAEESKELYYTFLNQLKQKYKPELIKGGEFGAYMQVDICNDGPVTINLDSCLQKNEVNENKTEEMKIVKNEKLLF